MKNYTKCEEELTFHFKVDMGNWTNFDRALENLKNLHFSRFFLSKVYTV